MALTAQDLKIFQAQHPDHRLELVNGEIIVMSPCGYESDEIALEIGAQLRNWVRPRRCGRVTGSSAGFVLPNSDTRAPDVSFVRAERMPYTTEDYAQLVPDLIFEVRSKTDRLDSLRAKIRQFLELGTTVGALVDYQTQTIEVCRRNAEPITLHNGDRFTVPELLPGWEMEVSSIWAPEFN
ncbi:MAG: Uma2 family endonuclease [Drouetiella hepatica Uher 2000/2452]|jgi:Uma2 family endonuclease|uniref:Uma2 family endonuclease n=1 Tax=Drouetiella hepatica Uher 2000/2452 TaxID=904376 RepID=A0A951QBJ9_9CYAN|nr:Uma2 family endonuclease [Drouetiella hepatica Uher 2000/2452]